jgi:hypothetical protein
MHHLAYSILISCSLSTVMGASSMKSRRGSRVHELKHRMAGACISKPVTWQCHCGQAHQLESGESCATCGMKRPISPQLLTGERRDFERHSERNPGFSEEFADLAVIHGYPYENWAPWSFYETKLATLAWILSTPLDKNGRDSGRSHLKRNPILVTHAYDNNWQKAVNEFTKSYDAQQRPNRTIRARAQRGDREKQYKGWIKVLYNRHHKIQFLNMFPCFIPTSKGDVTTLDKQFEHFEWIKFTLLKMEFAMEFAPTKEEWYSTPEPNGKVLTAIDEVDEFLKSRFEELSKLRSREADAELFKTYTALMRHRISNGGELYD